MATLFLARRVGAAGFSKHVAIKVVHPHLAEDPNFVQMFVDEALLSAQIQHPNVVHVEELRQVDGAHFLVMEYVSGCALSQLLRELAKRGRRLSPQLAVHIAVRIEDGLHAAHELRDPDGSLLGVVHRDVSPQNVLLAWEGHVKLIDFGVAKARFRSVQTTGSTLKGKIRYMAPEQAIGRPVDRRSDVYALGVVLWEMLTMKRLFHADNDFALLELVRQPRVTPPSQLVTDVSPELDRVVMKALAPRVEERYQTARQLRRELADAMPRAVALDASHLSELLVTVMGEHLARAQQTLPAGATGVDLADAGRPDDEGEVLATMTVSATGVEFLDAASDGPSARSNPSFPSPPAYGTPASSVTPAPSSSRRMLIGLALVSVVALALGAAITIPVALSSRPEPSATPLPVVSDASESPISTRETEPNDELAVASAELDAGAPDAGAPDAGPPRGKIVRRRAPMRATMRTTTMASAMGMSGVPLADDFGF
jgi:serine/threonine-protein kinase